MPTSARQCQQRSHLVSSEALTVTSSGASPGRGAGSTLAFDVMARAEVHAEASVRAALVLELARAAGIGGMAGGQMLDLAAEGRFGDKQ